MAIGVVMVEKCLGGGTPIGGPLYGGPIKWRMFFISELGQYVEMTSEMEFLTFAHTLYCLPHHRCGYVQKRPNLGIESLVVIF